MRAAVMRDNRIVVDDIPVPEPRAGEVLVKTLACGICGSDLHVLRHARRIVDANRRCGGAVLMDADRDVVMGHEFCAEIVEYGPQTSRRLPVGTRVCSVPVVLEPSGPATVGYSNENPGGYGEYMRLSEALLLPVPAGLKPELAALTEPMAVGAHAVAKAGLGRDDVPLVVGCGPIGLAVISALRLRGSRPIVAADFSPRRRALAEILGADIVVDPALDSPFATWSEVAPYPDPARAPARMPWDVGPPLRPAVIFECVGVPGVIQQLMQGAPYAAKVVVVGVCMEPDHFEPFFGINKELGLQFVLGYTPEEFAATLRHIADGNLEVASLVTAKVGISGVANAFEELASPEQHAKVVIEPARG